MINSIIIALSTSSDSGSVARERKVALWLLSVLLAYALHNSGFIKATAHKHNLITSWYG